MQASYLIHKNLGETPLEALERLRAAENIPSDVPMTYAGRLDPAAEGLLVILAGEECKKKESYTGLDKTYVAEILFGVSTDTHDLLGLPVTAAREGEHDADLPAELASRNKREYLKTNLETAPLRQSSAALASCSPSRVAVGGYLDSFVGTFVQKYPQYSSKTLFQDLPEAPTHEVTLHSYSDLEFREVSRRDVLARVQKITELVKGDFRQKEILAAWQGIENQLPEDLIICKVTLEVGSGFYIRQLAEDMGKALGTGACLFSLVRTRIQMAGVDDSQKTC